MTFKAFVGEWEKKFVQKNLEHNTILNYMMQINKRIVPYFGALQMEKIKPLHIITYLEKLQDEGLGSATVVYNYRVLRSVFSKAVQWRVIKFNPMDGVSKPKEKLNRKLNVYDEDESIQLFKALQNESIQFKILVSLALTTGMRRGELLGLEWKHVDLDSGIIDIVQSIPAYKDQVPVIKLPKTKDSYRKVALSPSMIEELKDYKKEWNKYKLKNGNIWTCDKEQNFLFCNKHGMPYYPKSLGDKWRSFLDRNKHIKRIRFHDLRHTSATLLINQGVHAKIISERLGHADIGTTMDVYGHVIKKADQKAAAIFDQILAQ